MDIWSILLYAVLYLLSGATVFMCLWRNIEPGDYVTTKPRKERISTRIAVIIIWPPVLAVAAYVGLRALCVWFWESLTE